MLKYLFYAEFEDGTIIEQDPEDISALDPKRSSFYDVTAKEEESKLTKFTLVENNNNHIGNSYSVDLRDGYFTVNHVPFRFHEIAKSLDNFRLVFFRRHKHKFNSSSEELHQIVYRMGWQANDLQGNNVQEVMEID